MRILENYSCFQQFFFKFSKKKKKKNYFRQEYFLGLFLIESGHIPDFENEDNVSIGISLSFEVICN